MRYHVLALLMVLLFPPVATAGYKDDFEKEFLTKTWAGAQIEENFCIACHSSDTMKPEFREITDAWQASWHARNDISCENCHGGDPKDPSLSMSPHRGFVGSPRSKDVPAFCGKCHIGILSHFEKSGHGKALAASRKAPHCVTCHGSHNIQKASIDLITEQLCTKCHAYERAKIMKQALFLTEKKFAVLDRRLQELKHEGIYADKEEKSLFNIQAEFRTLFHTEDVNLVKERTDGVTEKLDKLDREIMAMFRELNYRKNFSAFLMLAFCGLGIIIFVLSRIRED
jgi:hypothetical protein